MSLVIQQILCGKNPDWLDGDQLWGFADLILNYCVISVDLQKPCTTDNIRILTDALCAMRRVKTEITYSPAPILRLPMSSKKELRT